MANEVVSILQASQVGVEATPGTAVAATHRLGSIGFTFTPKVKVAEFTPQGGKAVTVTSLVENYTEVKAAALPTYTELEYLLSSVIGNKAVAADASDTAHLANTWTFQPNTYGADAVDSLTIEQGAAGSRSRRVAGCVGTELQLHWASNADPKADATFVGGAIQDGITLTPGPLTALELVPVNLTDATIYIDPTAANIGTTKATRVFDFDLKTSGRRKPFFTIDAANAGTPAGVVEAKSTNELTCMFEADTAGMAFYNNIAAGSTSYVRAKFAGPVIPGTSDAAHYGLTIDLAVKVKNVDSLSDHEGIYAVKVHFVLVDDNAGNNQKYVLTNGAAAL